MCSDAAGDGGHGADQHAAGGHGQDGARVGGGQNHLRLLNPGGGRGAAVGHRVPPLMILLLLLRVCTVYTVYTSQHSSPAIVDTLVMCLVTCAGTHHV